MQKNLSQFGAPGVRARAQGLALVISVGLHIALLAALIAMRHSPEPSIVESASVVQFTLVEFDENTATDGQARSESRAEDGTSDDVAEIVARNDGPITEAEPVAPEPIAERAAETASFEPAPTLEPLPTETANEASAETPIVTVAEPSTTAENRSTDVVTEKPLTPVPVEAGPIETRPIEAAPLRTVPIETTPIATRDRDRLERQVVSWAKDFVALDERQTNTSWTDRGQAYTAAVTNLRAADNMGIDEAIVTISTERDGQRFSTEMRMQRLSFSHFAQFINRWDPSVQIHDDQIDGRFHSNSEIFIDHSRGVQPTFLGKVTTTREINTSNSSRGIRRDEVFLGGLETHANRIGLPKRVPLFADDNAIDPDRVRRFNSDTRIEFQADGTYTWHPIETRRSARRRDKATANQQMAASGGREALGDEPHYLIAAENAVLHISGVVDGKVFVYSPKKIVIEGDINYADHPAVVADSDDYLGLVSDGRVEIAPPAVTGPGDLTVHAAIYAKRRFAVLSYRHFEKATLHVFGSVTAGSLSATEPRYRTKLNFDDRLANLRPPNFPMTDSYEVTDWDGLWKQESTEPSAQ